MGLGHRSRSALLAPVIATFALASVAVAQEHAGVVTTLQGRVTVARTSLPAPALLKFRDPVFVRDRIATGKESFARILLGGKAVVTVREFSAVTITEVPGVATVDVGSGRVAVAVARERMRPGDLVEVRTPNAVAGIRGTVIVAEVFDAQRSIITVLKGVIDVTRLDAGRAVGSSTVLNALLQVMINGAVSAPQPISSDAAQRMGAEFRTAPPSVAPKGATASVTQAEVERVATDLAGVAAVSTLTAPVESSSGTGKTAQSDQPSGDSDKGKGSSSSGTATVSTGSGAAPASSASASAPAAAPAASASASAPAPVASVPVAAATPAASAPAASGAPAPVVAAPAVAPVAISIPSAPVSSATNLVNNIKSGGGPGSPKDKSNKKN